MVLLTALTVVARHGAPAWGLATYRRKAWLLIDANNRVSLARLRALSCTLVAISAFLAGALANISANPGLLANSLSISVPEELWILMA